MNPPPPPAGPAGRPRWLACDFGPQFGDNFRGFLFLKELKLRHPEVELTVWITPALRAGLAGLLTWLDFVDRWLVAERPPRRSYEWNFAILKTVLARGLPLALGNLPGGTGPDGATYHRLLPTAEPWLSAKLLAGAPLAAPDRENQGAFLARLLACEEAALTAASPLFGRPEPPGEHLCLGLCRPRPGDPKQPAPRRVARVWEAVLAGGREVYALDRQDWFPPPASPRVHDLRALPWEAKVAVLNTARRFIGVDGGLNHFAAACGCPTLAFYGRDLGPEGGLMVGPYPRRLPRGEHQFLGDFPAFLAAAAAAAR